MPRLRRPWNPLIANTMIEDMSNLNRKNEDIDPVSPRLLYENDKF